MFLHQSSRAVRRQWRVYKRFVQVAVSQSSGDRCPAVPPIAVRSFHSTGTLRVVKPVLLADIGEGIVECEIIQWFVEPEARVEEFSPLCEVQSDKASVEITSRFAGVVKKLYYEAGEMAKVGKPFVDIDIQGSAKKEDLEALTPPEPESPTQVSRSEPVREHGSASPVRSSQAVKADGHHDSGGQASQQQPGQEPGKHAGLATPAVRHLSKELEVDITQIRGTGRDGRVLKEDIYKFVAARDASQTETQNQPPAGSTPLGAGAEAAAATGQQQETSVHLTKTQEMMFKTMTRSLAIPHFLYADEVDFTALVELRARLNRVLAKSGPAAGSKTSSNGAAAVDKLSYLPFIIKAVSMALYQYPILNARVEVPEDYIHGNGSDNTNSKPTLVLRSQHNIGVAMDTPAGLLVPVIRDVGSRNIVSIAAELARLQTAARSGRVSPADLAGGTITVSNIGTIGGTYVSPVIVEREVAILGVGRMRAVPAFARDVGGEDGDRIVRREICNFSWSADHRVIDGATLARAADVVRAIVEEPDVMVMHLR